MDKLDQPEVRGDIVRELRAMAQRGATVPDFVRAIRDMAGYKQDTILPILWYFTRAFCLSLPAILPLREWLLNQQTDDEINRILLPHIESARETWMNEDD